MPTLSFPLASRGPSLLRGRSGIAVGFDGFVGRIAIAALAVVGVVVAIEMAIPGQEADAEWLGAAAAIILAARYAGFWPSVVVACGAAAAIAVLLLRPHGEFAFGTIEDAAALLLFLVVTAAGASSVGRSSGRPETEPIEIVPALDLVEPLTAREREILGLLVEGMSNRDIAARLVVSPNTVKTHLEHLYDKLGVSSRLQAAAHARELGIVRPTGRSRPLG